MNDQIEQLKATFHDIFQSGQADLDFGIYRIMRAKRQEFDAYLSGPLLADLRLTATRQYDESRESLQTSINKARRSAEELGYDPDDAPRVKKLRAELAELALKESLEESVLSDLVEFLRRYYKDGDFLSLPRYRKNSYALEYNGEEVKLHWANADQYYVKTAERFRDYRFLLPSGRAVHFKIKAANTETGNNKAETGKERRFQLVEGEFMREENGALLIFFGYEVDAQKRKQADINQATAAQILQAEGWLDWRHDLGKFAPTAAHQERTFLDKHLAEYTARNTFDYFIHKDLDGFLRRELDFYIKNEIVRLDDIENEDAPRVELYLGKVKALRRVGHKLIAFLAQVENLQKKLFLKKKFVVRAEYCATLDRVPRELWADILANDAQLAEWRQLYAIDEIAADLFHDGPQLNEQFLTANQNLIVDTRHFSDAWKQTLLASFDDLDAATDGVLIKSDNFHALNLLQEKYRESVKCIYIDPPYNTSVSEILYKNGYKHSSWLSMMENRVSASVALLSEQGNFCVTIDDYELHRLRYLLDEIFSDFNYLATVPIRNNPSGRSTVSGFAINHEYALFFSKNSEVSELGRLPHSEEQKSRYSFKDDSGKSFEWENFRKSSAGSNRIDRPRQYYPIYFNSETKVLRVPALEWQELNKSWVELEQPQNNEVVIFPTDSFGNEKVWRHGIERTTKELVETTARENDGKIELYTKKYLRDEGMLPRTWWDKPAYSARDNGTRVLVELFGAQKSFDFPKSVEAVKDSIKVLSSNEDDLILDYFGGSGTTAHAVINLNRADGGTRKYILVETNEYFDTVTLPRIKKVVYAQEWKNGKPTKREGSSQLLKYFALESYEDAMNNLRLQRTPEQEQGLLQFPDEFREDYLLHYMLEFEAQGSPSLLNLDNFAAPFDYQMKIAVNGVGETQEIAVDLVETFNYLIGLRVQSMRQTDGWRVVRGTTRQGERCLILWRTTKNMTQELADKSLNDFLEKAKFDFSTIDTLYLNGDAALPVGNVRQESDAWQIKIIETEFLRRMFEA